MIVFKTGEMSFPIMKGSGPQKKDENVTFDQEIKQGKDTVAAVLTGYELKLVKDREGKRRKDRPFHEAVVDIKAKRESEHVVEVTGLLGIRDASGFWNDYYTGKISYLVMVDVN